MTITKDLNWNKHIENIVTNAGKCVDVLNALKYKLDRNTLEKLYKAFIRSKLEYANIIWDNCSKQMSDLLEGVQYRAAKIISGAISRTSHKVVYKELQWETLETRRKNQRLRVLYKTVHGQAPSYLHNAVYAPGVINQRYVLRNENIPSYRARTSMFHNSFIPKSVREWNMLSSDLKDADTLDTFTSKLNKDAQVVPKWFYSGDRKLSIIHSRLRMLCSELNDHLFSHIHVIDNPSCWCGNPCENNKHFFLDCPQYQNERTALTNNLALIGFNPTLTNLLKENNHNTGECNIRAFPYIQNYIGATLHFS